MFVCVCVCVCVCSLYKKTFDLLIFESLFSSSILKQNFITND